MLSRRAVAWKRLRQPHDSSCVQPASTLNIRNQQLPQGSVALTDRFTSMKIIGKLLISLSFQELPQVCCLKKSCCQVYSLPTPIRTSSHSQVMKRATDCQTNYSTCLFWSLHKEAGQREFSEKSGWTVFCKGRYNSYRQIKIIEMDWTTEARIT